MRLTDRIGVGHVQMIVNNDLGWVFREQTTDDRGIDAHIEIADDTSLNGKLVAVQIKSGKSYFKEKNNTGTIFRFSRKHANYWLNHSLPVIIILFNPETQKCIWETIQQSKIEYTSKKNCKITIPCDKNFNKTAKSIIEEIVNLFPVENYKNAIFDYESNDVFALKACPACGKNSLKRYSATDYEHDRLYYCIECTDCSWSDWTE